jgi:hypothetical protein
MDPARRALARAAVGEAQPGHRLERRHRWPRRLASRPDPRTSRGRDRSD